MQTFKYSLKYIFSLQFLGTQNLFLSYGLSSVKRTFHAIFQFFHVCLSEYPSSRHKKGHFHIMLF